MKKTYRMSGVDCANCAAKMESEISKLDGVRSCSVNFMLQKLVIDAEPDKLGGIIEQAAAICRKIDRHAEILA